MKIIESGCIDCGLPCIHEACRHYKVTRYLCDNCQEETELYHFNDMELCADCILESLEKVADSWN